MTGGFAGGNPVCGRGFGARSARVPPTHETCFQSMPLVCVIVRLVIGLQRYYIMPPLADKAGFIGYTAGHRRLWRARHQAALNMPQKIWAHFTRMTPTSSLPSVNQGSPPPFRPCRIRWKPSTKNTSESSPVRCRSEKSESRSASMSGAV